MPIANVPHNLAVNGARNAVLQFEVHLRDAVLGEDGRIGDITCSTSLSFPFQHTEDVVGSVRMAADSTMLRMVKRLIALSFGVHREQLEQRIGLT